MGTGGLLGGRNPLLINLSAVLVAGIIWYLVQEALGIFLRPLPWFMS